MRASSQLALTFELVLLLALWLAACRGTVPGTDVPAATDPPAPDLRAQAAAEATAIIEQAQATALVLQAQAQATALVQQALALGAEPTPTPSARALPAVLPTPWTPDQGTTPPPVEDPAATASASLTATVELLGVGFAADGAFIHVSFRAPPLVVHSFWPGVLSVTDEASSTTFDEVPLMPVVGLLIGRPVEDGQAGYVMFVHAPAILRPGALVTVDLAGYKFEHVQVQ